jgi:hypothetical protein
VAPHDLADLIEPYRRTGHPLADIANRHALPPDGMTVNIPRLTTGTAVSSRAMENTAVQADSSSGGRSLRPVALAHRPGRSLPHGLT